MRSRRPNLLYFFGLPALAAAAGVLGYFTWDTATRYEQLGLRSIAHSTLLLAEEKVDRIESLIITQDNAVFSLVDLANPDSLRDTWLPLAPRISPSVRALIVLDTYDRVVAYAARANKREQRSFLRVFEKYLRPEMRVADLPLDRLRHLHTRHRDRNYLLSYKALSHDGQRFLVVAHHDTGYLVREELSQLWATEEGQSQYNVIDDEDRRIHGENLANAGDFLVGRRFPTTLYRWRLQVTPKDAAQLASQLRNKELTKAALIGLSCIVMLLGIVFLLYAATKERRLNELKSEFIANVSHELKTPLSVVRMFGEMLSTGRVRSEEKRQEYLEIIVRESERLTGLIENVLDFSAVERGRQTYELVETDFGNLITRAVETVRYRAERDGVEVGLELDDALPRVVVDEEAVLLAVINLIDNALKYGGGTPVSVSVSDRGQYIEVSVRDGGRGIPAGDTRRIFDRFYRAPQEGAQQRGSGIGLSLVKHTAEAHGGKAWAGNAEGGGAVVSFSVGVRKSSQAPRASEHRGRDPRSA